MAWGRLDEKYHDNPKIVATPLAALGLYSLGLSYCADQLTDGYIPRSAVIGFRGWSSAARGLVAQHLWEPNGSGWRVHDYLDWNPSREQVLAERAAARERKTRSRRNSGVTDGVTDGVTQKPFPAGVTP